MRFYHIGLCATGLDNPNGMQKALMNIFPDYREIHTGRRRLNDNIVFEASDFHPEVVFIQVQTPDIIQLDTLRWLKAQGCFVVNWTGDVRVPLPQWYRDWAEIIDLSLFTNETDVQELRQLGHAADYLDIGIDPEIYCPAGEALPMPEVVFFANDYGNLFNHGLGPLRREIVTTLSRRLGPRFGVFGHGWQNQGQNFNGNQSEEAKAYRGAKVAVNCSHFDLRRYSSDRLLRIMGSGCFCLTKYFPGLEQDYDDGVHLRAWYDLKQLGDLAEEYLINEEARQKIATTGCAHVHRERTFQKMAENLMQLIKFYKR